MILKHQLKSQTLFIAVNITKTHGEGKGMAADLSNIKKCTELVARVSKTDKIIVEESTIWNCRRN